MPEERLLVETDAPYLTPQVVRKQRNQPAFVAHTLAFIAELRGVGVERARRGRRAQRGRRVRLVSAAVADTPSDAPGRSRACAACAGSRFRPDRDLGQNFLIDSNILGVIERAAELPRGCRARDRRRPRRALGAPRRARRARARRRDRRAAARGAARRDRRRTRTSRVHWGDAMQLDLARARAAADEGRREPAVQDRGGR